jgi:hypothetical protein
MREDSEKQNNYYVYILLNNLKPGRYSYEGLDRSFLYEPFYVGKGRGKRVNAHRYGKDNHNTRKQSIIDSIKSENKKFFYSIYTDNLSSPKAFSQETILIKKIGRIDSNMGSLTNLNNGGNGPNYFDVDARKKISERNTGELNNNSKITKRQALGILNLLANGWLPIHIEKLFNLRQKYIDEFKSGKTWKYLRNDYPELFKQIKKFRRVKFTLNPRQIKMVIEMINNKIGGTDISRKLKLPYGPVYRILREYDKIPYIKILKECNLL